MCLRTGPDRLLSRPGGSGLQGMVFSAALRSGLAFRLLRDEGLRLGVAIADT